MNRQIFINLAVNDLQQSRAFYNSLGFEFNEQFCDDTGACLVISEHIHVMLLSHHKFLQFVPPGRTICDTAQQTEALLCLSCESRQEVDVLIDSAVRSGGVSYAEPQDHGWMYSRSFLDPDGHAWELMFADMSAFPADPSEQAATAGKD